MTIKEYLKQAYRLDHRIDSDLAEMDRLRAMAESVGAISWEEKFNPNRSTDAPFVRSLEKVWDLEQKINAEVDKLINLKDQIRTVIDGVENSDEQMVLRYRYIHNLTWEQIGDELRADARTVRRWHGSALQHARLPENPIII